MDKELKKEFEDLATEILNMLKLEIGKDINEYAIPNILLLMEAKTQQKIKEAKIEENKYWLHNLKQTGFDWVEIRKSVLENRIKELKIKRSLK